MGTLDLKKSKLECSALMDMIGRTNRKKFYTVKPNIKISVFLVMGLKILDTNFFFLEKIDNFMHFERHFAFQNA